MAAEVEKELNENDITNRHKTNQQPAGLEKTFTKQTNLPISDKARITSLTAEVNIANTQVKKIMRNNIIANEKLEKEIKLRKKFEHEALFNYNLWNKEHTLTAKLQDKLEAALDKINNNKKDIEHEILKFDGNFLKPGVKSLSNEKQNTLVNNSLSLIKAMNLNKLQLELYELESNLLMSKELLNKNELVGNIINIVLDKTISHFDKRVRLVQILKEENKESPLNNYSKSSIKQFIQGKSNHLEGDIGKLSNHIQTTDEQIQTLLREKKSFQNKFITNAEEIQNEVSKNSKNILGCLQYIEQENTRAQKLYSIKLEQEKCKRKLLEIDIDNYKEEIKSLKGKTSPYHTSRSKYLTRMQNKETTSKPTNHEPFSLRDDLNAKRITELEGENEKLRQNIDILMNTLETCKSDLAEFSRNYRMFQSDLEEEKLKTIQLTAKNKELSNCLMSSNNSLEIWKNRLIELSTNFQTLQIILQREKTTTGQLMAENEKLRTHQMSSGDLGPSKVYSEIGKEFTKKLHETNQRMLSIQGRVNECVKEVGNMIGSL